MKLGQAGYTLNSSNDNSRAVADLVNNYGGYAKATKTGIQSYVVGAIGGPTIELVEARTNYMQPDYITIGTNSNGYTVDENTQYVIYTALPQTGWMWVSSPSGAHNTYVLNMCYDQVTGRNAVTYPYLLHPVVCLKSSIPAYWDGSKWVI